MLQHVCVGFFLLVIEAAVTRLHVCLTDDDDEEEEEEQ